MKTRAKIFITLLLLLIISFVFHFGAFLLNTPNDFAVVGGVGVFGLLFIGAPTLLYKLWRSKKSNEKDSQQKPTA